MENGFPSDGESDDVFGQFLFGISWRSEDADDDSLMSGQNITIVSGFWWFSEVLI